MHAYSLLKYFLCEVAVNLFAERLDTFMLSNVNVTGSSDKLYLSVCTACLSHKSFLRYYLEELSASSPGTL